MGSWRRSLTESAQKNGRSLNSEMLWCFAAVLGGAANEHIEKMKVEKERQLQNVLQSLMSRLPPAEPKPKIKRRF
jgi:hypothetical protein